MGLLRTLSQSLLSPARHLSARPPAPPALALFPGPRRRCYSSPGSSSSSSSSSVKSLEVGILGMPNVGKSSLFNALTGGLNAEASNFPFCTIDPNIGILKVQDPSLALLAKYIPTSRIVQAEVRVVDIAGLVKGASEGAGLGNKFLSHVRQVDALMHVVRCFQDPNITHVDGEVNPVRDLETIETELILSDLQSLEKQLAKAKSASKKSSAATGFWTASLTAAAASSHYGASFSSSNLTLTEPALDSLMAQCFDWLSDGKSARHFLSTLPTDEDKFAVRVLAANLLTMKPMIYVANVDETQATDISAGQACPPFDAVKARGQTIPVCVKTEMDLLEVESEAERLELLSSLGMTEPATATISRAVYDLLGLQSYYTAGEKEIRAWSILKGSSAPVAAGRIHSDFVKNFIRAEAYNVSDLEQYKSEAGVKAAGKMRSEGKTYVVRPGDVLHFLINSSR